MKITSAANPRVKQAAKLRGSRDRIKQGRFIIDGIREIGRALDGGLTIGEVFVCEELCATVQCQQLLKRLSKTSAIRFDVTTAVFEKLAFGQRAEGVVAVADMPHRSLADLRLPERPLVVVIEGVEKPGNVGAILRSADGAGVSAAIVADGGSDLFNPNAIRASVGAIFTLPVAAATSAETIAWLRKQKLSIFAARVDGSVEYTACDFKRPAALVLGSEAVGLSEAWRGADVTPIRLPMRGAADSLNVSAAAAVLFYEALRQRHAATGSRQSG
jgi:TrmH family RNA methyltransferase